MGIFPQASLGCEIHSLELKMSKALLLWGPWGLGQTSGEAVTRGTAGGAGENSADSSRVTGAPALRWINSLPDQLCHTHILPAKLYPGYKEEHSACSCPLSGRQEGELWVIPEHCWARVSLQGLGPGLAAGTSPWSPLPHPLDPYFSPDTL